uniref:RNA-directed DNA polymerase n=1 Tax=Meloidogyne enterolobii TaxID=390850 RepID=A0A6V7UIZ0_MELEN|nr:unnamed protein product [Meloidogyne enterolobii]CAD2205428.1 unnamed protein product [Meloidogyne enterolobii]
MGIPWIKDLEVIPKEIMKPCHLQSISANLPITDKNSLINSLQTNFSDVFGKELGHVKKFKAHLYLKQGATPTFCKARPVPYGALPAVNAELDRLVEIGAIKPINFSHWAAPVLAVKKKNGKTRICIDFSTGLNNALELNRHPLPRPEDIYMALNGAKLFSRLDLRDAYLQMELDEESKKLCAINTHRGLFQCQRLPFGVKSAPSIFQHLIDQLISGISGVFGYLDDIVIASKTFKDHTKTLKLLLKRIQDYGLKLQLEKCDFLQERLLFLGHVVSPEGIKPDPGRSEAIRNMPAPHDKSTLRSFLGALTYYGRFIKKMREIRSPLDELLKKDIEWKWTETHQKAFERAKEIMLSDLLLTHYDPKLPIIVAADASKDGIGATISHVFPDKTEKVIEHASCTLTAAQRNYSQIEKEALALVFAVQKFHRMLYGRKFTLQTDHKPLVAIFGSKNGIPINSASRLQRWALILTNYDFDIQYINTKSFGQADVLSRLIDEYPRPTEDILIANISTDTECYINSIFNSVLEPLPVMANEIAEETDKDPVLSAVKKCIDQGWPRKNEDQQLAAFYPKRDAISEIEGCLIYGQRMIIPKSLQSRILKTLHIAHPGIVRMKAIAKEHVYWPGIGKEIEKLVHQCEQCQGASKNPAKTLLTPWLAPNEVFERVHVDFAGPCSDGYTYLLFVDAFSKWPEVCKMHPITAKDTVEVLQSIVYRLGIPKEIVSDNGRQFRSHEFATFCKEFGIKHTFTPPYHPMSNGQVERFVDTFKRSMKKCGQKKNWIEETLLAYRTTHASLNGHSPDELFLGRHMRTKINLVHPEEQRISSNIDKEKFKKFQQAHQQKMTKQFNTKHGSKLSKFRPGEPVYLLNYRLNKTEWLNGTIIEQVKNSPTYRVKVPAIGRDVHRHVNQLRKRHPIEMDTPKDVGTTPDRRTPTRTPEQIRQISPRPESPKNLSPKGRPQRNRRPINRLDPDPDKKRY